MCVFFVGIILNVYLILISNCFRTCCVFVCMVWWWWCVCMYVCTVVFLPYTLTPPLTHTLYIHTQTHKHSQKQKHRKKSRCEHGGSEVRREIEYFAADCWLHETSQRQGATLDCVAIESQHNGGGVHWSMECWVYWWDWAVVVWCY